MFTDLTECGEALDRAMVRAADAEREFGEASEQFRAAIDECQRIVAEYDRLMAPLEAEQVYVG